MKKVLALVLALAMILGCFSFVSAAEFTDVAADADYHDAAAVLSDLGIASGYTDGTFKPEKVVTRAEMAAFIIKALGISPAASAVTTFSDVPASHWASGYIAYATSLGIVSGYTDGTFKPDQTVSYDQAVTMLIQALGYTADSLTGTYPAAYVSKAKALGILDGVDTLGTAGANRGDIAILLYNTLGQYIGHVDNDGAWTKAVPTDNMFGRHGAYLYVDADGEAKNFIVTESTDSVIDLSSYLGKRVTAYLNEDGDVVAIYEVNSTTVTGKINADVTKIGDYKLDRTGTNVKDTDALLLIENGESQAAVETFGELIAAENASGSKLYVKKSMTFECKVKGNYIVEVYSAQKWTKTKEDQMTKTMLKTLKNDEPSILGVEFEMTRKDAIDTDEFVLVGVASLDEIKVDDIVSVYKRPVAGTVAKVVVSSEVVTGKITKLNSDKDTATIGGTSYDKASGTFPDDFTNAYKFYLNGDGEVAAYTKVTDETTDAYGILTDVYCTVDTSKWASGKDKSGERKVNIFTAEGKTVTFTLDNTWDEDEDEFEVMPEFEEPTSLGEVNALVVYTLDEDGKLVDIARADDPEFDVEDHAAKEVEKIDDMGLVVDEDGAAAKFASKAVIFCADVDDDGDYTWTVKTVAEAKAAEYDLEDAYAIFSTESKTYVALAAKFEDVEAEDKVYGVFTGKAKVGTTKWEVSFITDGVATTYEVKDAAFVASLTEDGALGEMTMTGTKPTAFTTVAGITYAVTDDATLDDGTYIINAADTVVLDDDLVVIYFDGDDAELVAADEVEEYLLSDDYTVTCYNRVNSDDETESTVSFIVVKDAE